MRLARVVGNVVSTVKDEGYAGQKLLIIEYLGPGLKPEGARLIAFDCADAGVGDTVLVNVDGGAANMFLGAHCIADLTVCGVVDSLDIYDFSQQGKE
jgi:microcompartment protein CcmK/EutM